MKQKITDFLRSFLMWFAVFYLIMWGYNEFIAPKSTTEEVTPSSITLEAKKDAITLGNVAMWELTNNTPETLTFTSPCEAPESLTVNRLTNGQKFPISDFTNCEDKKIRGFFVSPEASELLAFKDFNAEIFSEAGKYNIEIQLTNPAGENQTVSSNEIEIENPGLFRRLFRAIISKPLFNTLVLFTQNLPGKSLGWAIVLLTLLVRLLLFIPNQKSMRSQRELQKLQPKIAELKEKYKGNQQALAMKTMELYKTHKVNPMSSCLPMLIQLPIMLGVYYIVQDGVSWHMSYLLYGFNQAVDLGNVVPQFFGMNLEFIPKQVLTFSNIGETWMYALLPIFVGGMQWLAIKMSFIRAKKKNAGKKPAKKKTAKPGLEDQMQNMTGVMQWAMPAMIVFFTFTFPAAVGIYWVTSTLFGIAQQKYVNWKLDQPKVVKKID